jgi:hypothetical protein
MKRTRNFAQEAKLQGSKYFDMANIKGIKSEVSVRSFELPEYDQVIENYKRMFEGFRAVLDLSSLRNFGDIFLGLETFMKQDHNILVRAYLVNNLFTDKDCYFGLIRNIDLIMQDWKGFGYNEART